MAKIKVTMKQSYNDIVLCFRSCFEAGKFMDAAMEAAEEGGRKVSFAVGTEEPEGQGKAPETGAAAGKAGGEDA